MQTDELAEQFVAQYEWVIDNQDERNIVFVTHEGDVADDPSSPSEWERIDDIFSLLDDAEVPYSIAAGNHDINRDATAPEYDARFGVDRFERYSWYRSNHAAEGNRSSYSEISVDGHDLLFLHIRHLRPSFGDVDAVLAWADGVLADHPDHLVFVTTHEFTTPEGEVAYPALESIISEHCNVAAVFSGHLFGGAARGAFDDDCGRTVQHMLTNYQNRTDGGEGFLRTVEVDPVTLQASFQVYSPVLDEFNTEPAEEFTRRLAALVPVAGDVDCDRDLTIGDALVIAQFSVGSRTAVGQCPLVDPASTLHANSADINADGVVNVGDALIVARCSVGIVGEFCE